MLVGHSRISWRPASWLTRPSRRRGAAPQRGAPGLVVVVVRTARAEQAHVEQLIVSRKKATTCRAGRDDVAQVARLPEEERRPRPAAGSAGSSPSAESSRERDARFAIEDEQSGASGFGASKALVGRVDPCFKGLRCPSAPRTLVFQRGGVRRAPTSDASDAQ